MDDWETAQAAIAHQGDGLPLVIPTPQRVGEILDRHGLDGDQPVAVLAPAYANATWRGIAENAVMAGCLPEYLGVVSAALLAMAEDEYNLLGVQTTTGSAGPITIVNGPIAQKIGLNAAGNALGPGVRANATIGRALSLILRNIGGALPGECDMATLGSPAKYTFCFAENEQASPWPPFHTTRGFHKSQSVVTVAAASGFLEVVDAVSTRPEDLIRTFAGSMVYAGAVGDHGLIGSGQPLLILPPEQADFFHRAGMTREDLQTALFSNATLPLDRLSSAVVDRIIERRSEAGDADASAPVRIARRAADILIVVAGGIGIKAAYIPTWSTSRAVSKAVCLGV